VLIGERQAPFPVELQPGDAFPDAPQLLLTKATVLAQTTIRGLRGLVLQVPPYPEGGEHGGHVLVVWNPDGHGAFVSLHLGGYPRGDRVSAALKLAASWR